MIGTADARPILTGLKALLTLAAPVIAARLGVMAMGLTDAIVVGRYSARELGYQALGWAPTGVVLTAAVGLLAGVQVMTARRIGEGRPSEVGAVFRRGLSYSFWIGLGSTLFLLTAGPWLLHASGIAPDLAEGAGRVLIVLALSMTPYLLSIACSFFLEGLSRPGPGMVAIWAANGVNLVLGLWLVRGGFGAPALGAVGAAWATVGSRTALMLAMFAYIALLPEAKSWGVFKTPARDRSAEAEQRRIGFGAGASLFVEAAAFSGMNIVAGWLGGISVAAWAVLLNISAVVFMAPLGLSSATAVLVGRAYGARDGKGVTRSALTGMATSLVIGGAITGLVICNRLGMASVYTRDPGLLTAVAGALGLTALYFIPDGLQAVIANALRARGDVLAPTITHMVSYAAVMLPLGYILAHPAHLGLMGIVWAVLLSSILAAGLLFGRFAWLTARRR